MLFFQCIVNIYVPDKSTQIAQLEQKEHDSEHESFSLKVVCGVFVAFQSRLFPLSHDTDEKNVDGAHEQKHEQVKEGKYWVCIDCFSML